MNTRRRKLQSLDTADPTHQGSSSILVSHLLSAPSPSSAISPSFSTMMRRDNRVVAATPPTPLLAMYLQACELYKAPGWWFLCASSLLLHHHQRRRMIAFLIHP